MATLSLSGARRVWLEEDGIKIAREYQENITAIYPEDLPFPKKKNRLILTGRDPETMETTSEEFFATSVRGITVGREIPGGEMGDRYGILCAGDARSKAEFVIGGGKVQPDFDGTSADRLYPGEDCELVRGAMVSENDEELRFPFVQNWNPEDARNHKLWGNRYFLCGVRLITDEVRDPESGIVVDRPFARIDGLRCVDVCFLAITHERLGNFEGQPGETKTRFVKPASELLREISHEDRRRGKKPYLNYTQSKMLAFGLLSAKKIFGPNLPAGFQEVLADGEEAARSIMDRVQRQKSLHHFIEAIQEAPWVV